ncbi:excinuclease ABC subunit A [Thermoflavifilum aggregans]|uniref:UvrABC system protein A n=1 Tax=Thermoflavifilum aggregans TaxID=454188 RepID=A0A2M9CSP8_9BACT|nr:excinuclease ABC subunit UvrA [Thermoflavifilum aggregans]PJJ74934.1 excinuclease ABC subunit A [Thermoflavifilum aggregans]
MNQKTSEAEPRLHASDAIASPAVAEEEGIAVQGARVHNLKNISVTIPKNRLVVITGVSGSGKSSLAFDTIYAEGQRRYLESFGAYARQFIGELERPDVDQITGLSPVISIEQKTTGRSPRSTVGTVTEVYDFMRLLFARIGEAYSYNTGKKMIRFSEEEIIHHLFKKFLHQKLILLAPVVRGRKGHYRELFEQLRKQGYLKVRVDGEIRELVPKMQVDRYKMHDIEIVVDRIQVEKDQKTRITQSVQKALETGKGLIYVLEHPSQKLHVFSKHLMCADTGISYEEPSPNTFSFNSPYGACPRCKGLGAIYQIDPDALIPDPEKSIEEGGLAPLGEMKDNFIFKQIQQLARKHGFSLRTPIKNLPRKILNLLLYGSEEEKVTVDLGFEEDFYQSYETGFEGVANQVMRYFYESPSDMVRSWAEGFMKLAPCPECNGTRLKKESLWFKIHHKNIAELSAMDLRSLQAWFDDLPRHLNERQLKIGHDVLKEIHDRLHFLLQVGLDYLTLDRPSKTLSGGESQRIRLATQIGSQLMGITYILDEPSIGLHQRDNHRLIQSLKELCQMGNTVIVVEHDRDIMLESDYIIDIGPGAGVHGGHIVGEGAPEEFKQLPTLTAAYLRGEQKIPLPAQRRKGNGLYLKLYGASGNNLKKIDVSFPLGTFICITGVSGSGKSTLINETLFPVLHAYCYGSRTQPLPYQKIEGLEYIDKVIEIDQSPIGRTPRSNPATYCGFFTDIRQLFAQLPESKIRGYNAGRFSFNVKAGRCPACEGAGWRTIEMNFLPDVYVPCEQCHGRRYNRETLEIRYKGKSIADVLDMTVDEAVEFFQSIPYLYRKIKVLQEVGLGYITLGQSAVTLSGGEAQRVKLATELGKKDTGRTFYILDEPTTGLHFQDIQHLLDVLQKLVDRGNTVLVIEHNMDVIKVADYIIDLGPEGGVGGGYIVCQGTPEEVAHNPKSHTGMYLKQELT